MSILSKAIASPGAPSAIPAGPRPIELPYVRVLYTGPHVVPAVAIRFVHPTTGELSDPVNALIDTGNDETAFPMDWFVSLDIDLSACEDRPTYTGGGTLHGASVDMPKRLPTGLDAEVVGRRIHLPTVVFSPTLEHPVLLGRDFLAHFRITVDQRHRRLWLTPND
jgi:predicted aspartyl protease